MCGCCGAVLSSSSTDKHSIISYAQYRNEMHHNLEQTEEEQLIVAIHTRTKIVCENYEHNIE